MLGVVAPKPVRFDALLCDVSQSLAALSNEHADGWGIATENGSAWELSRSTERAAGCRDFERVARGASTRIGIAHVRKRTVGPTALDNTHPFVRGPFAFAHNGTVSETRWLERRCSAKRLLEIRGDTDSERLFAFVLSQVDAHGDVRRGLAAAGRALAASPRAGTASFLFSDGETLFAFRLGRALFMLERGDGAGDRRARARFVASQPLTGEPWREVADGTLVEVGSADLRFVAA
jgi:glutamine amidotransferase